MEPGASPAHLPTTAVVAPLRVGTLALAWISPMPDSSHLRAVLHAFAQIFLQRHAGCGALVMLALASGAPALASAPPGSAIRRLIETTVSTVTTPRCSARCW